MSLKFGDRVEVYWNLRKDCYSVRVKGKVVRHLNEFVLTDVTFHVSEAGRQRALRERRKNVHAVLRGTFSDRKKVATEVTRVVYNPYKYDSFVMHLDASNYVKVKSAGEVYLSREDISKGEGIRPALPTFRPRLVALYPRTDGGRYRLCEIEEQHIRHAMACTPEPHVLLLDEKAAEVLAREEDRLLLRQPKLLFTGDTLHTTVGTLLVIRVPDTKGKPLVLDQWGRASQ